MDAVRSWAIALCAAAIGCTLLQILAPKDGMGRIFKLLIAAFFLCCLAAPDTKPDIPKVIRPAVEYIAEHFREEATLETLADLCHVSVTHLIRCFARYIGFRPHDYLQEQRLRHAKVLLTGSALSIEQIAEQSGFNSASHFSRVFRSREKMTPSKFRSINF